MMMIIEIDDFHQANEQRLNLVFLLLFQHNKSSPCIFYSNNFNQTKKEKAKVYSINLSFIHFKYLNQLSNHLWCEYWTFRLNRMTSLTTVTDDEKKRFVIISYMFECGKYRWI